LVSLCHASLDKIFVEACCDYRKKAGPVSDHSKVLEEERQDVLNEIQSLWDEVVPVAHMATEAEFLKPILDKTGWDLKNRAKRNLTISGYVRELVFRLLFSDSNLITDLKCAPVYE
jgi:hypothetical protein